MDPVVSLVILYATGIAFLVADIFLPSHGFLTLGGLGFLAWAVWQTFSLSVWGGYVSLVLLAIFVPTMIIIAVRTWHRTPIGRRISPPNPVLTAEDAGGRPDLLQPLIGQTGSTLTPLRPVGECLFGTQRVECVAESGMIDRGVTVQAVGIVNVSLVVRPVAAGQDRSAEC